MLKQKQNAQLKSRTNPYTRNKANAYANFHIKPFESGQKGNKSTLLGKNGSNTNMFEQFKTPSTMINSESKNQLNAQAAKKFALSKSPVQATRI